MQGSEMQEFRNIKYTKRPKYLVLYNKRVEQTRYIVFSLPSSPFCHHCLLFVFYSLPSVTLVSILSPLVSFIVEPCHISATPDLSPTLTLPFPCSYRPNHRLDKYQIMSMKISHQHRHLGFRIAPKTNDFFLRMIQRNILL